jgi:hypothetical protein
VTARIGALAFVASGFLGAASPASFAAVRALSSTLPTQLVAQSYGSEALSSPGNDEIPPTFPASASVSSVQAWLSGAIQLRLTRLVELSSVVNQASELRNIQRAALDAIISNTTSGITGLLSSVPSDTTIASLQVNADAMVTDYRVLSVVSPQVTTLVAIDSTLASAEGLATLKPGINAAIYAEKQAHKQVGSALSTYEAFSSSINSVTSELASEQQALLVLSPENYSGSLASIAAAQSTETTEAQVVANAKRDVNRIVIMLAKPALRAS